MENQYKKRGNDTSFIYEDELKRLNVMNGNFKELIKDIVKEYPCDKTRKLIAVSDLITEILGKEENVNYTAKNKVEEIYKLTESVMPQEESGFNMDDVLYPKEKLDLMELCNELGVNK